MSDKEQLPVGLNSKRPNWSGIGLLLLVNLIALSFLYSPGTGDVSIWGNWIREIWSYGLIGGYAHSDTDYPPLAFVLLAIVSRCAPAFGITQLLMLKCSLLLFLYATAACFYWFTRSLVLTAALELALTLNSIGLAYLDIYFAPFLIAGLFFLQRGNLNLGFVLFVIGCFAKWQPLIIAPFVCLYVLGVARQRAPEKHRIKTQILPFALGAGVVALPLTLVFGWKVFDSLQRAMTRHAFLSGYALNLGWLQTWALHLTQPDKYGALQNGEIGIFLTREPIIVWPHKILLYSSYAAILFVFARQTKSFERLIVYSMLGYMAYFTFNTGVHENHLFLICCLAWILVCIQPEQLVRSISLTLAANANLFLFYGVFGDRLQRVIAGVDITIFFAIANICLFLGLLIHTVKIDGFDLGFVKVQPRPARPP